MLSEVVLLNSAVMPKQSMYAPFKNFTSTQGAIEYVAKFTSLFYRALYLAGVKKCPHHISGYVSCTRR
jgi:hypothetical protein